MKVLVLTSSYPTAAQPVAGSFVREYALTAARVADVVVAHLDRGGGRRIAVKAETDAGLPLIRVAYPQRPFAHVRHLAAAHAAWRALPFEPDVIHAHFVVGGVPAVALGRLHRKPVIISENWGIFLPDNPDPVTLRLRLAARFAFGGADLVLPVSEAMERALRTLGVRTEMRVVPNPVDEELFHPPTQRRESDGPPRLLTVGLFYDGAKGIDLLVEAVAQLGRPFVLDIVGDGRERAHYEQLAHELGLDDAVAFHGVRPKSEVADLMRRADAFVLASRFDNNPNVLLEALMTGLPSAATSVGGIPELLDERNGVVSPPHDAAAFAHALGTLLDRLPSYDRAAIAREARERFGRRRIATELERAYADVLGRRR